MNKFECYLIGRGLDERAVKNYAARKEVSLEEATAQLRETQEQMKVEIRAMLTPPAEETDEEAPASEATEEAIAEEAAEVAAENEEAAKEAEDEAPEATEEAAAE